MNGAHVSARDEGLGWTRWVACLRQGVLSIVVMMGVAACGGITQDEYDDLMAWFGCQECTNNERQSVEAIGDNVVPFLADALAGRGMANRRARAADRFGMTWSRISSPAMDSAVYVSSYLANYDATLQSRAAISLGDLEMYDTLRVALDEAATRGYRSDVVEVIAEVLAAAPTPATGTIGGQVVDPNGVALGNITVIVERCGEAVAPRSPPSFGACETLEGTSASSVSSAAGVFTFTGLTEGAYQVRVDPSSLPAGLAVGPQSMLMLLVGPGDNEQGTFTVGVSTSISGVVVNDRDLDNDSGDPNEILSDAWIRIYAGSVHPDSLAATLAGGTGAGWTVGGLPEGQYWVEASYYGEATPLSAIGADAVPEQAVLVTTTPATPDVGTQTPLNQPHWTPESSTTANAPAPQFTFLFDNGTINGSFEDGVGNPIAGLTVTLRRCRTFAGPASPPVSASCNTYFTSPPLNATTNASGQVQFFNLQEGAYEVTPNPATVGLTTATPSALLYHLVGSGDVEAPLAPTVVN